MIKKIEANAALLRGVLGMSASVIALGVGAVAFAQETEEPAEIETAVEEADEGDVVVVTGSRIARPDNYNSVGPVNIVGKTEIAISGKANLGDLLEELPSVAFVGDGTNVNNGSAGLQTVNLRGLGTERLLVLMNGRRVSPVGSGINNLVDLSIFPATLIDSVEVLKDGAAAVYGADAVSGVLNIITNKNYEGFDVMARAGTAEAGDGERWTLAATMGVTGDRGNMVLGVSYYEQEGVYQADRAISECPYLEPAWGYAVFDIFGYTPEEVGSTTANPATVCSGSSFVPAGRIYTSSGSRTFDEAGNVMPFDFFQHYYNFNPLNYLRTPSTGLNALATGNYEIADGLDVSMELLYNKRGSKQDLAPVPLGNGAQFTYGLVIPEANPFNPFGEDVRYRKRMLDVGARLFDQTSDTVRAVIALNGEVKGADSVPFIGGANWELSYSYDGNQVTDRNNNLIDMFRVEQAFDTEVTTLSGAGIVTVDGTNYRCADPLARQLGCEPLNMFGFNSITPGAAEFIRLNTVDQLRSSGQTFGATISNTVFDLPAGPVSAVFGFEHRITTGSTAIDAAIANGYSSGNPALSTDGEIKVSDFFGEVEIPVLSGVTGFEELTFNVAARYSDYDQFDASETIRLNVQWAPIEDLRLRANYSTSYRAPSLSNLFNGGSGGFPTYSDPCASASADVISETTAAGICAGQGVTPGVFSTNNAQLLSFSVGSVIAGNELAPEEGKNWTVGAVYRPSFLADYNVGFAVDYYNITVSNAIGLEGLQGIINECYRDGDAAQCAKVTRQNGGDILRVNRAFQNEESEETAQGIDFSFNAGHEVFGGSELFAGDIALDVRGSYIIERADTDPQSGESFDFANRCAGFTAACVNEWRVNAMLGYTTEKFRVAWSTRFLSGIDGHAEEARELLEDDFGVPTETADQLLDYYTIDAMVYNDLNLRFSPNETLSFSAGIDNVFDVKPPHFKEVDGFFNSTENSPVGTYDTLGRYFFFQIDASF